jgi:uncharacterized protein
MTTPMAKAMTDLESEHVNIVQVRDIAEARRFYEEVLGCLKGPGGEQWFDFNLYGRQVVFRLNPRLGKEGRVGSHYHLVQGKYVPVSHCCFVLEMRKWRSIVKRLKQHRVKFVIERYRHSKNTAGAQATLFLRDPSGNALEVQSFFNSAAELLRCELQRALAGWMPWVIVTAFIVGCILLVPKKSEDEIAAGHFAASAHLPPCANVEACLR